MPESVEQNYGLTFPAGTSKLDIEFHMIRCGGKWAEPDGRVIGLGLYEHYKRAQRICWPEDDEHKWSELELKTIVSNPVSVFLGSSDSGKTYGIAKFILTDWWAFPDNTLWMVSSTELRGAELRIWGTLKQLFNRARDRFPSLAGHVLESFHAITTEQIDATGRKARLLTKGLIFIPCMSNGRYVGMGKFIGVKPMRGGRLGHVGDECFPAGTLVDTLDGPRPIERIQAGELVWSARGIDRVKSTTKQLATELVHVRAINGASFVCTPQHKIFTQQGWVSACELNQEQYMLAPYEAMRVMRSNDKEQEVLQQQLWREMVKNPRSEADLLYRSEGQENLYQIESHAQRSARTCGIFEDSATGQQLHESARSEAARQHCLGRQAISNEARGKWNWSHTSRESLDEALSGCEVELLDQNRQMERQRVSTELQSRFGISRTQNSFGSGWKLPPHTESARARRKEDHLFSGSWVDSVTFIEPKDLELFSNGGGGIEVYNLAVENHPSYSVNGFVVHNCQAMPPSFLDAYSNWMKPGFRGILSGNPFDLEDSLCKAAEPVDGWPSFKDNEKTQTWRSKFYDAAVVAFDGRDSPNFDEPKNRFPYLIGPKKISAVERYHGKDSWQFYNQCIGKPRSGMMYKRVITRELCEQFNAFDDVIWAGSPRIRIAACDAAYGGVGGDDCIAGHIEFGEDVEGNTVIACHPPVLVPVSVKKAGLPEEQIAKFVREYCEGFDIPPENFFFDARSTMAITFARIWSSAVNAVDFGSMPSDRPVSLDTFVWDGDTNTRRIQKCFELYSKFVTELWYTIHYVILSNQMRRLPREVAEEGYKREWKYVKGNRIEIEPKADMKLRTGKSPDRFDWLVAAVEGARRRGFEIKRMANEKSEPQNLFWLENALDKKKKFLENTQLNYA